ncbi:MAG: hypothetical protein ACRC1K_26530 [Planctomycetia bacterium]
MTNVNCLDGVCCPTCGQEQRFLITALVDCEVTDDGAWAADHGHYDWDGESACRCPECGRYGRLREFRRLPPDPEGMNDSRAEWAGYALAAFVSQTGTDPDSAVADLLCDLMHLADREGTVFAADLERARMHYEAETQPDLAPETSPATPTKGLTA